MDNRHQRSQPGNAVGCCGPDPTVRSQMRNFRQSNLARPRSKLLLMPPTLRRRPALEYAAPEKAEAIVDVQSVLRRADEANGGGFRIMQNMPGVLFDLT